MKTTRKVRSSKRKTLRQRGGKWECGWKTEKDQWIRNVWSTVIKKLKQNFDNNFRGEFHRLQKSGNCNLWVWKVGETSKTNENHIDIYWYDYDNWILGMTITKSGYHVGNERIEMEYASNYSQDKIATEIAQQIDVVYDNYFY